MLRLFPTLKNSNKFLKTLYNTAKSPQEFLLLTDSVSTPFSKQQVRDAFNRAAPSYDQFAVLQREVCERLLERLDYIKIKPRRILDIGAGTGQGTMALATHYPDAHIIAMDMAENMLQQSRTKQLTQRSWLAQLKNRLSGNKSTHYVCADAEQLPFSDASVDMIFSSLTIQWCADLMTLVKEFRRVLKPGGLLLFTSLGPQTLHELRHSWAAVSDKRHVNEFTDMHEIGDALYQEQFEDPVMDSEMIVINYQSVKQILQELKGVGAQNHNRGREQALMGKQRLQAMYQAYEHYRSSAGYPLSYEVLYGHAWNPKTPIQHVQADSGQQVTAISVSQLKASLASRRHKPV
jgi:malonyl-CoA O-methyltransferase